MARGISRETRSKGLKTFEPKMNKNRGLNMVKVSWSLRETVVADDATVIEFRGLTRTELVFEFTQHDVAKDVEAAKYFHNFKPVSEVSASREVVERGQLQSIKQLIEELTGKPLTDEDYDKLTLDLSDSPNGEEVIAAYKKLFTNVFAIIDAAVKPNVDVFWLKLLLYDGDYTVNSGSFGLGLFPGDFIERFVQDTIPAIKVNVAKGESIIAKAKELASAPVATTSAPVEEVESMDWMDQ